MSTVLPKSAGPNGRPAATATPATPSAQQAQQMLANGAILIVAGCPVGTEFGIDLSAYRVDAGFRGVKMIPPGVHYVYTASAGQYGDTAQRVGFAHFFQPQEVVIRQWSPEAEELHQRPVADEGTRLAEAQRIRGNLRELDKYLAPYDSADLTDWQLLTQHISATRLLSTLPLCGLVRTAAEFQSCPDSERPRGAGNSNNDPATISATAALETLVHRRRILSNRMLQQPDDAALLPDLQVVAETALRLPALPARCPATATPAQVTAAFMDCFDAVRQMIGADNGGDGADGGDGGAALLADCQTAFVCFAAGCSVDALAHWRRQLHLLAHSERAVARWPQLYAAYVRCVAEQLPRLPDEMLAAGEWNTVYADVRQLVRNCGREGTVEMLAAVDVLVERVQAELGWVTVAAEGGAGGGADDEDDPEDAPVVVELDEHTDRW